MNAHSSHSSANLATSHIYLLVDGAQRGPYMLDQIRNMWSNGSLTSDTLWWTDDMKQWESMQSLPLSVPIQYAPQQHLAPTTVSIHSTQIEKNNKTLNRICLGIGLFMLAIILKACAMGM